MSKKLTIPNALGQMRKALKVIYLCLPLVFFGISATILTGCEEQQEFSTVTIEVRYCGYIGEIIPYSDVKVELTGEESYSGYTDNQGFCTLESVLFGDYTLYLTELKYSNMDSVECNLTINDSTETYRANILQ